MRRLASRGLTLLACASFFALHSPQANVPPGDTGDWGFSRGHSLEGSPEEVIQESALKAFDKELPHWLHKLSGRLAGPLTSRLPDVPGVMPNRVATARKRLVQDGSVLLVDSKGGPHRLQQRLLFEVCHVLGFALDDEAPSLDELACPELWVDEGWPPYKGSPMVHGRSMPVWSAFGHQEQALIVFQARLLSSFPEKQIKALIGYELGRMAYSLLSPGVLKAWSDRFSQVFVGGRVLQGVQTIGGARAKSLFGLEPRFGSIHVSLFEGRQQAPQLYANGILRPIMEFLAMDMALKAWAPRVLRPIVWIGLLLRGGPEAMLDSVRQQLQDVMPGQRRSVGPLLHLATPWLKLLTQLAALQSVGALMATCGRSAVLTSDRAAALAAGDAHEAAAAILRVFGQMPLESARGDALEAMLFEAAESAERHRWGLRREALLARRSQPAAEERVRALLQWSGSGSASRLMALAEVRRASFGRSWWPTLPSSGFSLQAVGHGLLVALVAVPFFTRMDLVRWASLCTLVVTVVGILSPMLLGGLGLPLPAASACAGSLLAYCSIAWMVWWNHLLGGSRRWAELSSRLSSQLADQADVTAGIAYLTRDWAEMARRSHTALDQEFCGSWRTSLHEVASKLTDIWQDIRNASLGASNDAVERAQTFRFLTGAKEARIARSESAPLGGKASMAMQLWLKVDRAVQRALHVEVERMNKALENEDARTFQSMTSWWSASNSSVASAASGMGLYDSDEADTETLGSMLLSERLHQRFQYRSFNFEEDARHDEPGASIEEFQRLEQALSANFDSLQELRGRLAPMADSAGALRCPRRDDLLRATIVVQQLLQGLLTKSKGKNNGKPPEFEDHAEDRSAEWRIILCLCTASLAGFVGLPFLVFKGLWLWVALAGGFATANLVLLLNYQRLSLPHVHRRLERQLGLLSSRREEILVELRDLQKSSQRAGAAHARASIFLQSVNVLRNINYVLLCIKTEAQRGAASGASPSEVILGGLRLLFALLPRCERRWEAEILADEDCGLALAALGANGHAPQQPVQQLIAESQKRLWILLRMVHLSSVLPIEAQGQLGSLVQRYARPILIEGRVPLNALDDGQKKAAPLTDRPKSRLAVTTPTPSEGNSSLCSQLSVRSFSGSVRDSLRQLRATRKDVMRILQRLPAEALVRPCGEEELSILHDLFTSAVLLLPSSGGRGWSLRRPSQPRPAVSVGYRHGDQVYQLDQLRSNILVRLCTTKGPEEGRSGCIAELRTSRTSLGNVQEIEMPLTAISHETRTEEDAELLWMAMAQAYPGSFGEDALQERKRNLRRVPAAVRRIRERGV